MTGMERTLRIARSLEYIVTIIGRMAGWLIPALMFVIVMDVVLRHWFVIGSTALQELEWHLHGALFLLALGYAYFKNAHVRIEIFYERWSVRTRAWVELWGIILMMLPYCAAILWFASDYAARAFLVGESSPSPAGLPDRWIIKSTLVLGFAVLGLAGISRGLTLMVFLFGPKSLAQHCGFPHQGAGPYDETDLQTEDARP